MAGSKLQQLYGAAVAQGYFFKAGALTSSWVTVADVAEVTVQAQVAQSLGLRTLYLFPVTVRRLPATCCRCALGGNASSRCVALCLDSTGACGSTIPGAPCMQALWLIGPTAMLISAVITTGVVAVLDFNLTSEAGLRDVLREVKAHPHAASV